MHLQPEPNGPTLAALDQEAAANDPVPQAEATPRPPLLVTIPQAAEPLPVSRSTVYQLIWDDELAPIRIGRSVRLTIDDLEDYVQRKRAA